VEVTVGANKPKQNPISSRTAWRRGGCR